MPSFDFDSVEDLCTYLQTEIDDSLENDIAPVIINNEQSQIQKVVYDSYTPVMYIRRKEHGGIIDASNIHVMVTNSELTVSNDTPLNGTFDFDNSNMSLNDCIILGTGYKYPVQNRDIRKYTYLQPRNFLQPVIDFMTNNSITIDTLKDSLNRKGIQTD